MSANPNLWSDLAAPFVVTVTRESVVDRLDAVVNGDWDITLDEPRDHMGMVEVKCRLQILGIIREAIGRGVDGVDASGQAFLAAAALYRIGRTA